MGQFEDFVNLPFSSISSTRVTVFLWDAVLLDKVMISHLIVSDRRVFEGNKDFSSFSCYRALP